MTGKSRADIGIIGGTGVYDPTMFKNVKAIKISTPFGEPSDLIFSGVYKNVRIAFIPRHGRNHTIPPHRVNYRANVWALKQLGVERIIASSAVGSLRDDYAAGNFVVPDQFIDRTKKRLDTFVKTSVYLPDVRFVLIGRYNGSIKHLKKIAGSNVMFTGYVSDDSLLHYCRRAKVYCQLSTHEGFGVALAEAMSCCCVPVVTRRYALPEVVGDTGFYVPYDDPKVTAEVIKKALRSDKGRKARERIKKHFSLEARKKKLIEEILDFEKY